MKGMKDVKSMKGSRQIEGRGPAKPGPPGQLNYSFNLDLFMSFTSFMPFMFALQLWC